MAILERLGELTEDEFHYAVYTEHDEYSCDCHETCGGCLEPFLITSLARTDLSGGTFICPSCRYKSALERHKK